MPCELHTSPDDPTPGLLREVSVPRGPHGNFRLFALFPEFDARIRRQLRRAWPADPLPFGLNLAEGLEDFRFGARCIRDAVRAYQILTGRDDAAEWESLPERTSWIDPDNAAVYREHGVEPSREDEAAAALRALINPGLSFLQPRLDDAPRGDLGVEWGVWYIPLYSICCLELYNHVVQRAEYRQCANENCRKVFVHQTGRAVFGQHRSHGVTYCDFDCAHRQNQRNFRRKKARQRRSTSS